MSRTQLSGAGSISQRQDGHRLKPGVSDSTATFGLRARLRSLKVSHKVRKAT